MTAPAPPQEDIDHWTKLAQQYDSLPFASKIHSGAVSGVIQALKDAGVTEDQMKTWNVLEVGGGTGAVTSRLLPLFASIHVTDTSSSMLTQLSLKYLSNPSLFSTCSHNLLSIGPDVLDQLDGELPSPIVGDEGRKRTWPEERREFDLVVGTLMLHHVEDVKSFMEGVRKLVRPGGYVVFEEFEISEEQEKINESAGHHHHHHHHHQSSPAHGHSHQHEASSSNHTLPPKSGPQGASAKPGVSVKTLSSILTQAGLDADLQVKSHGTIPRPNRAADAEAEEVGNLIGLGKRAA